MYCASLGILFQIPWVVCLPYRFFLVARFNRLLIMEDAQVSESEMIITVSVPKYEIVSTVDVSDSITALLIWIRDAGFI